MNKKEFINEQNYSMKIKEKGLYTKFNNIVFTPCIILPKKTTINTNILLQNLRLKRKENINNKLKNDYILRPLNEINNEILYNLNYHKSLNDKNGIDSMIQICNQINEIKESFYINNKI